MTFDALLALGFFSGHADTNYSTMFFQKDSKHVFEKVILEYKFKEKKLAIKKKKKKGNSSQVAKIYRNWDV